jgi:hypothetical protein
MSPTAIAEKTLAAATSSLRKAAEEPGCYLPLLGLSRLAAAAKSETRFNHELGGLGVSVEDRADGFRLLAALERATFATSGKRTVFTDIAERAYRETLLSRVRNGAESLWGITPMDVRRAFAAQSTAEGYSEFARDWFGRFVGRTLQYFIDRELSNHVGPGAAKSSGDAVHLERDVLAYANERTRMLRDFAPGWFSKTQWTKGGLPEESARNFFGYAIKKIVDDVHLEGGDK